MNLKKIFIGSLFSVYTPFLSPVFQLKIGEIQNQTDNVFVLYREDKEGKVDPSRGLLLQPSKTYSCYDETWGKFTLEELQKRPEERNKVEGCEYFTRGAQLLGGLRLYNRVSDEKLEVVGTIVACIYEELDTYIPIQGGEVEFQVFFKAGDCHKKLVNEAAWISDFKSDEVVEYIVNVRLIKDERGQLKIEATLKK